MAEQKKIVVIDGNSVLHRAFHALPPLTARDGQQVGAVYGFLLVFLKVIGEFRPEFLAVCFDYPALTFRHEKFKEYKAQRPPTPKELAAQIPQIKRMLGLFSVPVLEKKGFEADDLIGTVSRIFPGIKRSFDIRTIIVSGDRDVLQLINAKTRVYLLAKGVKNADLYDEDLIREKYPGLKPQQLVDLRALTGDASDNIPGVPGIGQKTALKLLGEFGSLAAIYDNLKKGKNHPLITPRIKDLLLDGRDKAFMSRELSQIKKDVPINIPIKEYEWREYDRQAVMEAFQDLGFKTLIKRLFQQKENGQAGREKTMKLL